MNLIKVILTNRNATFKVMAVTLFALIFMSPSISIIQNASAGFVIAQLTSAKSDVSNIANGALITLPQGKSSTVLTFEFRGFDDDNHVVELRCSFDGINYLRTNCPSQSAESQSSFAGPDGVVRTYNVKTGTLSRQLTASIVPKTFFFGVRAFNDNNSLSPASTITFKVRLATNTPTDQGTGGTVEPQNLKKIKVAFNSITVLDDHRTDAMVTMPGYRGSPGTMTTTPLAGHWVLHAFIQGEIVRLFTDKEILSGRTYNFQGKELTVDIKSHLPLSIFTIGYENVESKFLCAIPPDASDVKKIFTFPATVWKQKIHELQTVDYCDVYDRLGLVNLVNLPPDYLRTDPTTSTGNTHAIRSNSGDFILRYTISVEPN